MLFRKPKNVQNKPPVLCISVPLSSTQTPSNQHISSTQGPHLLSARNPSVQDQKPLSSIPLQFNTTLSYTPKPSVC